MYKPEEITNKTRLAGYLRIEEKAIFMLTTLKDHFLFEMKIPKRNKKLGYRVVYSTTFGIASIYKQLKSKINELYTPHPCAFGFIQHRGIVDNAKYHLSQKVILSIDIKDFFDTISADMVKSAFTSLGFNEEASNTLSLITTYNNKLVQGISTSPVIANIVCQKLDEELSNYCQTQQLVYTRYADDINISGDRITEDNDNIIKSIIQKSGFIINKDKVKYLHKGRKQYVTGLNVSDSSFPRLPKHIKTKLRVLFYYLNKFGVKDHICHRFGYDATNLSEDQWSTIARIANCYHYKLNGWLNYIMSIEPQIEQKYRPIFTRVWTEFHNSYMDDYFKPKIEKTHGIIEMKMDFETIDYNPFQ